MKLFLLRKFLLFFTVICAFFTACDSGSDSGGDKTVYAKEIVSFSFLQSNNDNLTKDIAGCVSDSKITVFVQGGTDLTALAPSISIQGSSVSPASGEAQDFSEGPVTYTVTAKDGSTAAYPVEIKEITTAKWTVLIHFAIDNNIDYSFERESKIVTNYFETLEAVKKSDVGNQVNIILMLDSYNKDTLGAGYCSSYKDGYYLLSGTTFKNDLLDKKAEINSGSIADSKDFIAWVAENLPAEHYMYSIFNHGGGFADENRDGTVTSSYADSTITDLWQSYTTGQNPAGKQIVPAIHKGIGFDNSHNSDCLTHHELGELTAYLKNLTGKKIDLFYPFACLMGGVELAYEIKDNASYLLSSEESFPAEKWSYEALNTLCSEPATATAVTLGRAFCDAASDYFTATKERDFTLSLVDLNKIDELYSAINVYAEEVVDDLRQDTSKAVSYDEAAVESKIKDVSYYSDLGWYLNEICKKDAVSDEVKAKAEDVLAELDNCVIYKTQNGFDNATGLSIFHDLWFFRQYEVATYASILAGGDNQWKAYISVMQLLCNTSKLKPDTYEPDYIYSGLQLVVGGEKQELTLHSFQDRDYIRLEINSPTSFYVSFSGEASLQALLINDNGNPLSIATYNPYDDDYYVLYYKNAPVGRYYIIVVANTRIGKYSLQGCFGDVDDVDKNF